MDDASTRTNLNLDEVNTLRQRLLELEQSHSQCQQQVEHLQRQLSQESAARQRAEDYLHLMLTSAQMIAWDMDLVTNRLVCTANAHEVWGMQEGTIEEFFAIIHPDDRPQMTAAVERAIAGETGYFQEYRVIRSDGMTRWLNSRGQVYRDETGRGVRLIGLSVDVTEHKHTDAQLRKSEERLRAANERFQLAAKAVNCLIYDWDIQKNRVERTDGLTRMLGYSLEEAEPTAAWWRDRIHPEDIPPIQEQAVAILAKEDYFTCEYRVLNKANQYIYVMDQCLVVERDAEGNPARIVGSTTDISDRRQVETELRESEQVFRTVVENTPDIIVRYDRNLRHLYISPSIERALGIAPEQFIGKTAIELGFTDERSQAWNAALREVFETGQSYSMPFEIPSATGELRLYQARFVPELVEGEHITTVLGVVTDVTEFKQAEAALARSNQTLQAIIQACPLAIMGLRSDGTVRIWNPAAERIFGWSQQEVLGKALPAIPDHKQDEFLANLAATISGQGLAGVEAQRQKKGNIPFDVELWTAPVDETQAEISCVAVVADITARKRTEAALRLSEERLDSFVSANVIGILFGDLEGGIQEANDEFLRIVGYSREDLQSGNLRWIDITPPEYLPLDEKAITEARRRGACTPYEKQYIRKDGSRVPVFVGFSLVLTVREEAVAFILDLSDRKQAEESLRQSEERLRLALLVGQSGIWDWDILNNHITWSEQIYEFHGLTPDSFSGTVEDFTQLIHPEDQAKISKAIQRALKQRSSYELEFRAIHPTGEIRWLSTKGGVIYDQQGVPVRMLGATIDITERKAIEVEREYLLKREQIAREQAEAANRVKDEFLAVLSHELRTPLNPILGWTKLLRTRSFDPHATDRALETIERNAKLQSQLIEDLLDVSRILQGKLQLTICPVNLVSTIEASLETVRLSAEAKGIQIQTDLNLEVGQVNGDANRLQQVLWNLLSNAIKFTPAGGRVEVRLDQIEADARIEIRDTGQGIRSDFLPHVFDYFRQADSSTTRQFGGLGLGLAIVDHLVELHGGTVQAESAGTGLGATFTVRLPLLRAQSKANVDMPSVASAPNLTGIQILLVDDDTDTLEFVAFVLEQAGARVLTSTSAPEAFATLKQFQPTLLVSDIGMPNMDGYMLIQQVRALPPEQGGTISAIALTAFAGELNQQQALAAGFQKHLSKPIEPDLLISTIASLVIG